MTNDPDMTRVFDITKGFCDTHGQTIFVCLKCQAAAESHESADSSGLALVQKVQALRAENARLREENMALEATLTPFKVIHDALIAEGHMSMVISHMFEIHTWDGVYTGVDISEQALSIAAAMLNGGAS